jgi:hypothetical protein
MLKSKDCNFLGLYILMQLCFWNFWQVFTNCDNNMDVSNRKADDPSG